MAADHKKGEGDSLYMNATGRQNKKEMVSISKIVLKIRRICKGLISFISGFRKFQDTNISRFIYVQFVPLNQCFTVGFHDLISSH